jgi:hypothetical protein
MLSNIQHGNGPLQKTTQYRDYIGFNFIAD